MATLLGVGWSTSGQQWSPHKWMAAAIELSMPGNVDTFQRKFREGDTEESATFWVCRTENLTCVATHVLYSGARSRMSAEAFELDMYQGFKETVQGETTDEKQLELGGIKGYYLRKTNHNSQIGIWIGRKNSNIMALSVTAPLATYIPAERTFLASFKPIKSLRNGRQRGGGQRRRGSRAG